MKNHEVHIGKIIKQRLQEQERSMAWLAQKVHCDRNNFYKKLNSDNIDIDLLLRISRALHEDFFHHYSELLHKENMRGG
ncbi:MAG: XRE family transcriptional regulator [Bacteroidales bacterium]|jgi:DNA-binding phage protein|nr:XRE family transcriptional regulator [Bacteroidales bacterium]